MTDSTENERLADMAEYCTGRAFHTRLRASRDYIVEDVIAPIPLWDYNLRTVLSADDFLSSAELKIPFCGFTQLLLMANDDCNVAFGVDPASEWNPNVTDDCAFSKEYADYHRIEHDNYDEETGFQALTHTVAPDDTRCSLREARLFSGYCSVGYCGADGVCKNTIPSFTMIGN
jgi:hypothetical protein